MASLRPFGEDFFCIYNKNLLFNLLKRNLKLKYRQSYLGILWTILVPALNALIYFFVFKNVLRVGIENYFLFVLSGLMPWQFFSSAVLQSIESMTMNANLINKVPVPPRVFPYAEMNTVFINYLLSLPILLGVAIYSKDSFSVQNFSLIFYSALLYLQAYGMALAASTTFIYLRDLRHILSIILQAWFYLTPIVYNQGMLPEKLYWVEYVNPVGIIFHGIHETFVYNRALDIEKNLIAIAWTLFVMLFGFWVYLRAKKNIVENL